ncbi:MAG: LysR family transcriptional regulator [Sphingomonas sp.]|uniref:LysR family transcriptional regulator n=1 Tax=Sphingomonas sp. TaxID=28214 RepID=UPI002609C34B|nr:LysR family transcriptional regulator [Sphingomonas sp.]MDK2770013.1 LysR family transcriptional regulator [Sphingomonas sp.]
MRFHKLDLNLLVALNALLEDKSVSLAAERIHLSQSATSSALGRLREYFQDELLVLKGRSMVLTPRAEELVQPVRAVLDQITATIAVSQPFDPAVSDRRLSILASDYAIEVMLRPAMLAFEEEAPGMTFDISPLGDDVVEELKRGRADLLIAIDTAISTELPFVQLWEDDFVVVAWSGNHSLRGGITRELYESLGHVVARFGRTRSPSFEEWALRSQAINRRVEVIAPSFTAVPSFLVGSQRIATMHRRLAERMARFYPLKILEAPLDIPSVRQTAQWASSSNTDAALMWLVGRLQALMQDQG